jgi:hypothetical protein
MSPLTCVILTVLLNFVCRTSDKSIEDNLYLCDVFERYTDGK